MIRLTIASADSRTTDIIDDSITPKAALEAAGINYTRATVIIDGCPMTPAKMNQSFSDLGITAIRRRLSNNTKTRCKTSSFI